VCLCHEWRTDAVDIVVAGRDSIEVGGSGLSWPGPSDNINRSGHNVTSELEGFFRFSVVVNG
jgi:hypothetical protein